MGEAKRRKKLQKDLIGIWCCGFVPLYLLFTGFAGFSGLSAYKTWTFYGLAAVLAVLAVLLSVFCLNIDNLAYTASATAHRATLSFATRLVERVESTPGYRSGMEVVIVGGFPEAPYHSGVAAFDLVDAPADSVLSRNKHVYYYLNDWLNVPWEEPDEKTFLSVSGSEAFQDMRLYPDEGSVVIEDGRVIVKLAWEYTPKKEYELQYENRK